MIWLPSPSVMPAVFSLALMAPVSASYSMKAIPLLPGTKRTSRKPSNRPKMAVKASISYSSGRFCTNRILFGGRYSSGTTAAPDGFEDFKPAPLDALTGRGATSETAPAAAADLFSLFDSSAASAAFFLSGRNVSACDQSQQELRDIPFSASRLRLCCSNSSSSPILFTVASLLVFAITSCIGFSKSSKP